MNDKLIGLPIKLELTIFANHGLNSDELTEETASQLKAAHCSDVSQSIFDIIQYVINENLFDDDARLNGALMHLAQIGASVSQAQRGELEMLDRFIAQERLRQEEGKQNRKKTNSR